MKELLKGKMNGGSKEGVAVGAASWMMQLQKKKSEASEAGDLDKSSN